MRDCPPTKAMQNKLYLYMARTTHPHISWRKTHTKKKRGIFGWRFRDLVPAKALPKKNTHMQPHT